MSTVDVSKKLDSSLDLSGLSVKADYINIAQSKDGVTSIKFPNVEVNDIFYRGLEERGVDKTTYLKVKKYEKEFNVAVYEHATDTAIEQWRNNENINKIEFKYPLPANRNIIVRTNPNAEIRKSPTSTDTYHTAHAQLVVKSSTGINSKVKTLAKTKMNEGLSDMGRKLGK